MCTHLGVMHVGKLVAQGSSAELRSGGDTEATVETDAAPRRRPGDGASSA